MRAFKVTVTQDGHVITMFGRYADWLEAFNAGLELCLTVDCRITVERDQ